MEGKDASHDLARKYGEVLKDIPLSNVRVVSLYNKFLEFIN